MAAEIESGTNTPSNSRISGASSSSKIFFSRQNTSDSPEYHDAFNFSTASSAAGSRFSKDTDGRALWGWYLYDVAASAYSNGVAPLFYPLLIYWLATKAALSPSLDGDGYQQQQQQQQGSDFWLVQCAAGNASANCAACVLGQGYRFFSADGRTSEAPSVRVSLGGSFELSPYSVVAVILGVVLVLQLLVFITFSPLIDHGRCRKGLLAVSTGVGVAAVMLSINLYSAELWWTAAILFIVSDVAHGQAVVAYNSFLMPLTKAMAELKQSLGLGTTTREQEVARLRVVGGASLTATGLGNLGGFLAIAVAYGSLAYVPGVSDTFVFRGALSISGLWWAVWAFPACSWLRSYKGAGGSGCGFRLGLGWEKLWCLRTDLGRLRYAGWVLAALLLSTAGSTALFQAALLYGRENLCMSTKQSVAVAMAASLAACLGCPAFACFQRRTSWQDNTVVIANLLTVMALTACYAVVGFVTGKDSVGLHHRWEVFAIAGCHGFCAGALSSFTRTLFLDCVRESQQGLLFSLYGLVRQAGVWLGYLAVSLFVLAPVDFRYAFVYAAVMLLVPAILLLVTVDHQQGMVDAGHILQRDFFPDDTVSGESPCDVRDFSSSSYGRVRDLAPKQQHHVVPLAGPSLARQ